MMIGPHPAAFACTFDDDVDAAVVVAGAAVRTARAAAMMADDRRREIDMVVCSGLGFAEKVCPSPRAHAHATRNRHTF
jgi:hypothetical protein